jgi:hypothetical protein
MEAVAVPGRISGQEVVADLLDRVAERLTRSCDLRESDSYASYSAVVSITLQLVDVDTISLSQQITVGSLDAEQLAQQITINVPTITPEEIEERLDLKPTPAPERPVDGSMPEAKTVAPAVRRYYTPRGSVPLLGGPRH